MLDDTQKVARVKTAHYSSPEEETIDTTTVVLSNGRHPLLKAHERQLAESQSAQNGLNGHHAPIKEEQEEGKEGTEEATQIVAALPAPIEQPAPPAPPSEPEAPAEVPVAPPKKPAEVAIVAPKSKAVSDKRAAIGKRDAAMARMLQERCRQLCLSVFYQERTTTRSLGFTSAIGGEGKTFLASLTAGVLANDSARPVTLVECNWEHPSLRETYGLPSGPGLAEWLRGECSEAEARYVVGENLSVIPAGNGRRDAVRLLQQLRERGLLESVGCANDLVIVDLPPIVTSAYGQIAAALLETLVVVVRAGVTPNALVEETCSRLKDVSVQGVVLNQLHSSIPRWIRQLL